MAKTQSIRKRADGSLTTSTALFTQLRAGNVSFNPEAFNFDAAGYDVVLPTQRPPFDPITERLEQGEPQVNELMDLEQTWQIVALDQATIDANIAAAKADLKARVTAQRVERERGGTLVGGMPVKTDPESQAKLTGAIAFVGRNPARAIKWKTAGETFVALTKAQIEGIADAVGEFVASCYDAEATHYAAIDALTTAAEINAYDVTANWPA